MSMALVFSLLLAVGVAAFGGLALIGSVALLLRPPAER